MMIRYFESSKYLKCFFLLCSTCGNDTLICLLALDCFPSIGCALLCCEYTNHWQSKVYQHVWVCAFSSHHIRIANGHSSIFFASFFGSKNNKQCILCVITFQFCCFGMNSLANNALQKYALKWRKGKKIVRHQLYQPWNFDQGFNVFVTYLRMQFRKLTHTFESMHIRFGYIHSRVHFNDHEIWCRANKRIDLKRIKIKISFFRRLLCYILLRACYASLLRLILHYCRTMVKLPNSISFLKWSESSFQHF